MEKYSILQIEAVSIFSKFICRFNTIPIKVFFFSFFCQKWKVNLTYNGGKGSLEHRDQSERITSPECKAYYKAIENNTVLWRHK